MVLQQHLENKNNFAKNRLIPKKKSPPGEDAARVVQWAHQPWLRPYAAPPQADPRGPDGGGRSGGEAYLPLVLCWESGGGGD